MHALQAIENYIATDEEKATEINYLLKCNIDYSMQETDLKEEAA